MAITNIKEFNHHNPTFFKESPIVHRYLDGLQGIEIGAASHNPFGLGGCINVGLKDTDTDDFEFFRQAQISMCGQYAGIDKEGDAANLPFEDESLDYVLTSHVIEHIPNPIKAFAEWQRVVKKGGYIAMIFPKRNALPADVDRPVSTRDEFLRAMWESWTADNVPSDYLKKVPGGRRGHYWVYTLASMIDLINYENKVGVLSWNIVEALETDDKVGNGHLIIARKQ